MLRGPNMENALDELSARADPDSHTFEPRWKYENQDSCISSIRIFYDRPKKMIIDDWSGAGCADVNILGGRPERQQHISQTLDTPRSLKVYSYDELEDLHNFPILGDPEDYEWNFLVESSEPVNGINISMTIEYHLAVQSYPKSNDRFKEMRFAFKQKVVIGFLPCIDYPTISRPMVWDFVGIINDDSSKINGIFTSNINGAHGVFIAIKETFNKQETLCFYFREHAGRLTTNCVKLADSANKLQFYFETETNSSAELKFKPHAVPRRRSISIQNKKQYDRTYDNFIYLTTRSGDPEISTEIPTTEVRNEKDAGHLYAAMFEKFFIGFIMPEDRAYTIESKHAAIKYFGLYSPACNCIEGIWISGSVEE
jgi:hypothetical protein